MKRTFQAIFIFLVQKLAVGKLPTICDFDLNILWSESASISFF